MRSITLNDGTEYTVDMCGADSGVLWLGLPEFVGTIADAVGVFGDAEKTSSITHAAGENDIVTFDGYTSLVSVALEGDGRLMVALKKE